MIDNMFVIRNHLQRDMPEISSIFDITNYKESFLTTDHINLIESSSDAILPIERLANNNVAEQLTENIVYKTEASIPNPVYNIPTSTPSTIRSSQPPVQPPKKQTSTWKADGWKDSKVRRGGTPTQVTRHPDQLFWTVYELHHGRPEFTMIRFNYGNRYLEERLAICQALIDGQKLRSMNHRITKMQVEEINSELMSPSRTTSLLALHALCCHYNMRIIILNKSKRRYTVFHQETGYASTHIIEELTNRVGRDPGYRVFKESVADDDIDTILAGYVKMHHYERPLAPISKFKVDELRAIANTLGVPSDGTKPEIYEAVSKFMA